MNNVSVEVRAQYVNEQSDPEENRFVYAYTVRISNLGDSPAKLIRRHWIIVDGNDEQQEVEGLGVVGQQPVIAPGESYSYTSGTVLTTQTGMMHGSYKMEASNGESFEAEIPRFALVPPDALH